MIGKIKKGASFGGCIRYVTGKDEAKILASDGVLLGTNAEIVQSFELQRQLNPRIKKPVGHIALSFKPEDKPRLTDEFMAKIALEYMQMMGIKDTQFIIVRHHNTDNPHCHIVYNRINCEWYYHLTTRIFVISKRTSLYNVMMMLSIMLEIVLLFMRIPSADTMK